MSNRPILSFSIPCTWRRSVVASAASDAGLARGLVANVPVRLNARWSAAATGLPLVVVVTFAEGSDVPPSLPLPWRSALNLKRFGSSFLIQPYVAASGLWRICVENSFCCLSSYMYVALTCMRSAKISSKTSRGGLIFTQPESKHNQIKLSYPWTPIKRHTFLSV